MFYGFPDDSVKNLPEMQETQVQSLGQEDALEEEMATHSSILTWKIPWTEEPGSWGGKELDTTENVCIQGVIFCSIVSASFFNTLAHDASDWNKYAHGCLSSFLHLSFSLFFFSVQSSSVQSLSHVRLFATPWTEACQASLSTPNSQSLFI